MTRAARWLSDAGVATCDATYAELKRRIADALSSTVADVPLPEEVKTQIELDLPRTPLGGDAEWATRSGALRSVLLAYALHEPEVGYVQGMHYMAAAALLPGSTAESPPSELDERRAFWWLTHCVAHLLPPGCYGPGMRGLQLEQAVLLRLLQREAPAVATRLESLGVAVGLLTSGWFLTLYQAQLPGSVALEALDAFAARRVAPLQLARHVSRTVTRATMRQRHDVGYRRSRSSSTPPSASPARTR